MKNIVFITFTLISFIYADTVGIAQKMWTSVPKDIYNETEPLASVAESNSREVSSWSQPIVESKPVVINSIKTLDDIKILTAQATQAQTIDEIIVQTKVVAKELTPSEKNWITAIETNVAEDSQIVETSQVLTPTVEKAPEKNWITVPDEVSNQNSEDLPLAKIVTTQTQTDTVNEKQSIENTGWIEASQNYNDTAFSNQQQEIEIKPDIETIATVEPITVEPEPIKVVSKNNIEQPKIEQPENQIMEKTVSTIAPVSSEFSSKIKPQKEVETKKKSIKASQENSTLEKRNGTAEILESPFDIKKYFYNFSQFIAPLTSFVKENAILFGSFLSVLGLFFYLLFYRPLSNKVYNKFDDEIDVPQARVPEDRVEYYQPQPKKEHNYIPKEENMLNPSIISQSEYSTLYGLMNETFIFEKERIILSNDITQERKNREVISLEWKFNQILHFSLPKLSTDKPKLFVEGVKELLDDEVSKDIMIIALKDILEKDTLTNLQKEEIAKYIDRVLPKKATPSKVFHNTEVNYRSYMS